MQRQRLGFAIFKTIFYKLVIIFRGDTLKKYVVVFFYGVDNQLELAPPPSPPLAQAWWPSSIFAVILQMYFLKVDSKLQN